MGQRLRFPEKKHCRAFFDEKMLAVNPRPSFAFGPGRCSWTLPKPFRCGVCFWQIVRGVTRDGPSKASLRRESFVISVVGASERRPPIKKVFLREWNFASSMKLRCFFEPRGGRGLERRGCWGSLRRWGVYSCSGWGEGCGRTIFFLRPPGRKQKPPFF